MNIEVRHAPSFAAVRVTLGPGEQIRAESGAMMATSFGVANHLAGDIVVADISPEEPMSIARGCWLASSPQVQLDTKWGGFKNLFGGEGGFLVHASGTGKALPGETSGAGGGVLGGLLGN